VSLSIVMSDVTTQPCTVADEVDSTTDSSEESQDDSAAWLEAEEELTFWATEAIAVRFRELGLNTDRPKVDLNEQFCEKPDCPPHQAASIPTARTYLRC
jgi:hypothetical protein